jgi:hypothetical protein
MIIYIVNREGMSHKLRTEVRNWRRDLTTTSTLGWYIEGVGFERPFDEFDVVFRARVKQINSLFMALNLKLRERDETAFGPAKPSQARHFPDMTYEASIPLNLEEAREGYVSMADGKKLLSDALYGAYLGKKLPKSYGGSES